MARQAEAAAEQCEECEQGGVYVCAGYTMHA